MLSSYKKRRNEDTIGARIKAKREQLGYTQKELAEKLGIEYYTMVSQIERGYMSLPPSLWAPVATALRFDTQSWVIECLLEIQPQVYEALFSDISATEAARKLRG